MNKATLKHAFMSLMYVIEENRNLVPQRYTDLFNEFLNQDDHDDTKEMYVALEEIYSALKGETIEAEVIEIDGKDYYSFAPDYFENEQLAEIDGYYWDDETGLWVKEIVDETTTIF